MCAELSTGTRSQGPEKNCHCPVINRSGKVTAQDHLSRWISNIHADQTERKIPFYLFSISHIHTSLPPWTFKPHFGLCC